METIYNSTAWNMVSEVELIYRSKVKPSERPMITCSADSAAIFREYWDENKIELQEQFCVLYLNNANRVLGIYNVSTGGVTGTVADPRLIFATALKLVATAMILAHSHPSGSLKPSQLDERMTEKITNGGIYLDIKVIDHIILSSEAYYSFADEGLL